MPAPRVSIILPFYNAADTIEDAVYSIIGQSFSDWELILADDGSEDESSFMAHAFTAGDRRIRMLRLEHGGIVSALQAACASAEGEILVRMDADDVSWPDRITRQIAWLDAHPGAALCGCHVRMTGGETGPGRRRYEEWLNALATPEDIAREIFIECPIAHPAFAMRRDAFESAGGYRDNGWPEDYDLIMRFHTHGMAMGNCPDILLDWRDHPDRLSMNSDRYSEAAFRALKRHYLFKCHSLEGRAFMQWGAGEVGKRWLREWEGTRPRAVVDINPRKIGVTIHDTPVIAPEELPPPGECLITIIVGAPGAREEIRAWLEPRDYREGTDFLFLA